MGRRGRASAAALAIVSDAHTRAKPDRKRPDRKRPAPPDDLTEDQAAEWRAIVDRCPADWFPRETYPLLAQYCRHAVSARYLSLVRDKLEKSRSFNVDYYERVSKLIGRETQLLASLATKMRLSQHASYDKKKTKGPTIKPPWED